MIRCERCGNELGAEDKVRVCKKCGAEPKITVEIKASSEEGFDRTTLDNKVKETLQQIQAKIEDWSEE